MLSDEMQKCKRALLMTARLLCQIQRVVLRGWYRPIISTEAESSADVQEQDSVADVQVSLFAPPPCQHSDGSALSM
jgi:hypothetical protein